MFDPSNEPINEHELEQAAPDIVDAAPVESVESVESETQVIPAGAAGLSAVDDGPQTPALEERETRKLAALVERMGELTSAIELFPDSPANYVLRGDLFLDGGDTDLAVADFEHAIRLADRQAETANWGYVYRALADRAREGLRRAG